MHKTPLSYGWEALKWGTAQALLYYRRLSQIRKTELYSLGNVITMQETMPYARTSRAVARRPYRRNTTRTRYTGRRPYPQTRGYVKRVPRSVAGYRGEAVIRKMRFALYAGASTALTSTTGVLATTQVYRANGLYDPEYTTAGSQPRTFDQYMAMYRQFCVLGSKLTLFFEYGAGSSTSVSMAVSIILKDGVNAMSDTKNIIEHNRNSMKFITAESDKTVMTKKYSWRVHGAASALEDPNRWGTASQDPQEVWYYHVNAWCPSGGTETVWITGYIDYCVCCFQAIQPAAS